MKLKALIEERDEDVLIKVEENRVYAEVGGRIYNLEVRQPQPDCFLFFFKSQAHELRVSERLASKGTFAVSTRGRGYAVTIVDPKRLRSGQYSDRHDHGVVQILAPMPGKVVRVQTEPGAAVEKGAGVVVVEAMKMQNEMKSPRAGVVVSINVQPGDTVNAGDVLAVIE